MLADVCFLILQHHFAICPCQSIATNLWLLRTPICRAAWLLRAPAKQREHGPRLQIPKSPNLCCFNSAQVPTFGAGCPMSLRDASEQLRNGVTTSERWMGTVNVQGEDGECGWGRVPPRFVPCTGPSLGIPFLLPDLHTWEQRSGVGLGLALRMKWRSGFH